MSSAEKKRAKKLGLDTRTFGGKLYAAIGSYHHKSSALSKAESKRQKGFLVRIVKGKYRKPLGVHAGGGKVKYYKVYWRIYVRATKKTQHQVGIGFPGSRKKRSDAYRRRK